MKVAAAVRVASWAARVLAAQAFVAAAVANVAVQEREREAPPAIHALLAGPARGVEKYACASEGLYSARV